MLHVYNLEGKSRSSSSTTTNSGSMKSNVEFICSSIRIIRKPILSNWFTIVVSLLITFSSVWISRYLPDRYLSFTSDLALMHVLVAFTIFLYAFVIPMLLIQLSTGSLGNSKAMIRFFNWPGWLPLSRISLSYLLVDPIVINLYNFRMKRTISLDMDMHITIMLAQSVIVYLASFFVYVALEAPLKSFFMMVQMKLMRLLSPDLS